MCVSQCMKCGLPCRINIWRYPVSITRDYALFAAMTLLQTYTCLAAGRLNGSGACVARLHSRQATLQVAYSAQACATALFVLCGLCALWCWQLIGVAWSEYCPPEAVRALTPCYHRGTHGGCGGVSIGWCGQVASGSQSGPPDSVCATPGALVSQEFRVCVERCDSERMAHAVQLGRPRWQPPCVTANSKLAGWEFWLLHQSW